MTAVANPLGDLQIGLPGVLEQFGEFWTHGRILLEQ
jgi:hypothetical protein